ncbi:DUF998 domain-containing protein [Micromonospora sp. NPDC049679]|uniref:DUF998 domain-containing protein n=1 Tax=Micromonospora sp. NPDC049679 TaxID=3155920 RepID=UPI003406C328
MADAPHPVRTVATVAGIVGGGVAVTVAVVAGPGPGLTGYVSEAGVASSAYAATYRLGIFALATGMLLLAATLAPTLRAAALLLAVSAGCTLLSAVVTCSDGCPLPPFERATAADLVHGGASMAAVAAAVFAMLTIMLSSRADRALRRGATAATAVALPLSAAVGLAMLLVGRGALVGVLERLLLLTTALWLLGTALTARRKHSRAAL